MTELAIGERDGRVVLQFRHPVEYVALDPQNATACAEEMARVAHACLFKDKPPNALAAHVRTRLLTRVELTMRSIKDKPPAYQAATLVDIVLSEVL